MEHVAQSRTDPPKTSVRVTEALVRRHQAGVWRYLRFLGSPASAADDLTQEVFLVLLRTDIPDCGDTALAAWLRGVARNLFLAARRQPRAALELLDDAELEDTWCRFAGSDAGDSYHAALADCLESLTDDERRALALRFTESASRDHMAQRLQITPEGVKSMLRRAKEKLRLCINRKLHHD